MLLLQRPVAVSALQDFQSKNNGGAVAPLQLFQGGTASLGLGPIVYLSFGAFPWIAIQIFHAMKVF
jgi:hypothetical protein